MKSKTGILSIVFGTIGIFLLPIIFGPLAIYLGIKARKENSKIGNIGIIIGITALILIFFSPFITKFILHTSEPVAVMVSGSMAHNGNFDKWWASQENIYQEYGITKEQFKSFPYPNGFHLGDSLIIKGTNYDDLKVGDLILFKTRRGKTVHRVVKKFQRDGIRYIEAKGDHNLYAINFEKNIKEDQIIGKVLLVIPKTGWLNIWLERLIL